MNCLHEAKGLTSKMLQHHTASQVYWARSNVRGRTRRPSISQISWSEKWPKNDNPSIEGVCVPHTSNFSYCKAVDWGFPWCITQLHRTARPRGGSERQKVSERKRFKALSLRSSSWTLCHHFDRVCSENGRVRVTVARPRAQEADGVSEILVIWAREQHLSSFDDHSQTITHIKMENFRILFYEPVDSRAYYLGPKSPGKAPNLENFTILVNHVAPSVPIWLFESDFLDTKHQELPGASLWKCL